VGRSEESRLLVAFSTISAAHFKIWVRFLRIGTGRPARSGHSPLPYLPKSLLARDDRLPECGT